MKTATGEEKRKNRRRASAALRAAALVIAGSVLTGSLLGALLPACSGGKPVTVGFSGQLTGIHSDLGVEGRNGVQLAVEDVNSEGGVGGRKIELIVKDDGNTPEAALEADRQLIEQGAAAIIGHMTSSQTLVALPQLKKEGMPLISPTASTPLLSGKKDNFFRINTSSDRNAAIMGAYACSELGTERAATVYDVSNEAYSLPYANGFMESIRNCGGRAETRIPFTPEEVDWDTVVRELEEKSCDTVMVVASAADSALFSQALEERGTALQLIGSGWSYTRNLLRYGGKAVEGMYFADSFNRESSNEAFERFRKRYRERYGREANFAAVQGYESLMFLAKGLEKTNGKSEGLIEALSSIESLEGLNGTLKFDEYGDVYRPTFITRVHNGRFVMVDRIDAEL